MKFNQKVLCCGLTVFFLKCFICSTTVFRGKWNPPSSKRCQKFCAFRTCFRIHKKHYNTPITLSEISQIACFQEEYFCHYFKKNMGVTYFQYLNEIRLSHIYRDLTSTDLPLKVLLEKHGFTNYKLFRKMFYEQFATTPGEYRKNAAVSD